MVSRSTTRIGVSHRRDRAKRPHGPPISWLTPAIAGSDTDGDNPDDVGPDDVGPDDVDPDRVETVTRASCHRA